MSTTSTSWAGPPVSRGGCVSLRLPLVLALAGFGVILGVTHAGAQVVRQDFYAVDGFVDATVLSGNKLYIGGGFKQVGPTTGSGVPIDPATGVPVPGFPKILGGIFAAIPDGSGGWYIGGTFSSVGGLPRNNIAHVLSDFSVSPWNPNADGAVYTLLLSGGLLYAGGVFGRIGSQDRASVAIIDTSSGMPTVWNAGTTAGFPVTALTVYRGTVWIAGIGTWASIGGRSRSFIAGIDSVTGLANTWDPYTDGPVYSLAISGNILYLGGGFAHIGLAARNNLAALDLTTGLPTGWNPNVDGRVSALIPAAGKLYVGGYFTHIGGQQRNYIARVDSVSGSPDSWNPNSNNNVYALAPRGGTMYAGGNFSQVGGQTRNLLAAIDTTTGLATAWNPNLSGRVGPSVLALAVAPSGPIYAGGDFNIVGGQTRSNLACLDLTTGQPTAWNPGANNVVRALATSGSVIYAGGDFTNAGGQTRNYVAAFDTLNGQASAWNPIASAPVYALAYGGSFIHVGGAFTNIGGQNRNYIAALSPAFGSAVLGWNPNANGLVESLAEAGGTLFVSGSFTNIGGQNRNRLAALFTDPNNGAARPWNPNANNDPVALALGPPSSGVSTLYVGGYFTSVGGQSRSRIAAIDTATASALAWDPNPSVSANFPSVLTLATAGTTVYAGGSFTMIGGQSRSNLAALDATSGSATAWNVNVLGEPEALCIAPGLVCVGGDFPWIGNAPQTGIAAISQGLTLAANPPPPAVPASLWIRSERNPSGSPIRLTYSLPSTEPVTVTVYDAAGRRIVAPIEGVVQAAGEHGLGVKGLPAGVYLCRLQAGPGTRTIKIEVLR